MLIPLKKRPIKVAGDVQLSSRGRDSITSPPNGRRKRTYLQMTMGGYPFKKRTKVAKKLSLNNIRIKTRRAKTNLP